MKKDCIPLNDCVLLQREKNTKDEVEAGDTKLYIDTSWYEYDHVIQHAIVKYVPKRISSYFKTDTSIKDFHNLIYSQSFFFIKTSYLVLPVFIL